MDWMQFVSSLVSALAWPIAVISVVFMLKNPILRAIPKIRSFKYGELHIDLTEELKSLQENLPVEIPVSRASSEASSATPSIPVQLAAVSPRAAVIEAWRDVEKALNLAIDRAEASVDPSPAKRHVPTLVKWNRLREGGRIDHHTHEVGARASQLRNEAIHMPEKELDTDDALAMATICEWLVERLNNA